MSALACFIYDSSDFFIHFIYLLIGVLEIESLLFCFQNSLLYQTGVLDKKIRNSQTINTDGINNEIKVGDRLTAQV